MSNEKSQRRNHAMIKKKKKVYLAKEHNTVKNNNVEDIWNTEWPALVISFACV